MFLNFWLAIKLLMSNDVFWIVLVKQYKCRGLGAEESIYKIGT